MPAIVTRDVRLARSQVEHAINTQPRKAAAHRGHRRAWRAALRCPATFETTITGPHADRLTMPRLTGRQVA